MSIKDIVNKIRKGVKAGVAAAKENNVLSDSKIVKLIAEFENSPERKLMLTGEKYYQVDNDIRNRKITKKMANGSVVEETFHANNKLAHAKYKNMVDEKIAYLLSKAPTYQVDEGDKQDVYIDCVKDILGKHFQYQLSGLGYEASNKGVGWLQVYIDEFGDLKTMVIPAEQCIPLWKDRAHMELNTMIRTYQTYAWDYDTKKTITNVEVWTADKVTYYRLDGKFLVADYEKNNDAGGPVAHYKVNDAWYTWGKVPFIPFKNNRIEIPDIKFVKSLVDG
ncbi:MAG: phage portal protein, partial [Lachnospiraceae bacterium]